MKSRIASDFAYQLIALALAFVVVHSAYVFAIRPAADAVVAEQMQQQAEGQVTERSWLVVVRDYEQEACFVLMLWALAIMGAKARLATQERRLLKQPLLHIDEGTPILQQDARELSRPLQNLDEDARQKLIPRALLLALQRFGASGQVTDAANAVRETCETEGERLDSELSMIRYIAWAIPSIGFIGTVRGIGEALGQAHRAVEGDIAGVTVSLGVAFNSTFIALLISILIMFCSHQLQLLQERLVLDAQANCDNQLLRFLRGQ